MAGHAAAGVCRCLSGESQPSHSCCKRQKSGGESIKGASCCETDCSVSGSESFPQTRADAAIKLTLKAVPPRTRQRSWFARPFVMARPSLISSKSSHRLKFARPPDLFLNSHAFLI
jgi:hypothetical protein